MAAALTIVAALICIVKLLSPEQLTTIVEKTANSMLDAQVSVARVELDLHSKAPFVKLEVDSLHIISKPMLRLRAKSHPDLPTHADTLLTIEHFEGSINLAALLTNELSLRDITFTHPAINLVAVDDTYANYLIYASTSDEEPESESSAMSISLNEFRIDRPGPLEYTNLSTGEHYKVALGIAALNGEGAPTYAIDIDGDLASTVLRDYNLDQLRFAFAGGIGWDAAKPSELSFDDFKVAANFIEATITSHVNFNNDLVVNDFDIALSEIRIDSLLTLVPDSICKAYGLTDKTFASDIALRFAARSTAPFNLTTDSLPSAELTLEILPGKVRYGRAEFNRVGGTIGATLAGNDLNDASVALNDFLIQGPATDLTINGTASRLLTDPLVKAKLRGHTNLQRLPRQLTDLARGTLSGQVTLDLEFEGTPSMISRDSFHLLRLRGDLDGHNLSYQANDTTLAFYADNTCVKLGTNERFGQTDSLLTGSIRVDSLSLIQGETNISITDLTLGVGASNRRKSADTTVITPMGGALKFKDFSLKLAEQATTIRVRDVDGRVSMRRFKEHARLPQFDFNLGIRLASFGSPDARMMLANSELSLTAHKIPRADHIPPHIKHTADSLRLANPEIPVDSIYAQALRMHRPKGQLRSQGEQTDNEVIYWGASDDIKKMLREWDIRGSIKSARAGMYTSAFPIRNRITGLNATFNTDSVIVKDVKYRVGHSDFLINGQITNIRRGITSRGFRRPLSINFDVVSDTIDINEIAGTAFDGAAAAEYDLGQESLGQEEAAADSILEVELGHLSAETTDTVGPLLIPSNIDLRLNMRADNVKYSDLLFNDFTGTLMAANGALNLHRLAAKSDMGAVEMSALYSAPRASDLHFGFGLKVDNFNIGRFTRLVPAVDSIMPMLRDMRGIVNADIAATCDIDQQMNIVLPSLSAAIRMKGDSLEIIDKDTYRTIGKWLMFKDKQRNVIDSMDVRMTVSDNHLQLYPVIFNIDRYRLGVQGNNDLAMNFDYHIAVLKSPMPFKFGINLKGNPDDYKIRLGKARLNENMPVNVSIVDTTRVNLLRQIENVFRRGVASSDFRHLRFEHSQHTNTYDVKSDTISASDSAAFIREGLIPAPKPLETTDSPDTKDRKNDSKKPKADTGNKEAKEND